MIVVTYTSVVLNLCRVELECLLPDLFGEVLSPPAVASEFQRLAAMDPRFIGILGILIQAKKNGLLPEIGPVLDDLESKAGFWISPSLKIRVLGMVRE